MNEPEWILKVVQNFYDKAKSDVLIGYHFRNIQNFEEHIPRIAAFWDLQLLGKTERSYGPPFDVMKAHLPLGIKRGELGRWLVLFRQTLDQEKDQNILVDHWREKLCLFEGIFLRFFGF